MVIKEVIKVSDEWRDVDNFFRLDGRGFLKERKGIDAVVCGIENVILTRAGERVMRPDFGCYVYRYLFAPLHPTTGRLIGAEIIKAVNEWESRAEIGNMEVVIDEKLGAYGLNMQVVIKDMGEKVEVVRILMRE